MMVPNKNAQIVKVIRGRNPITLHENQIEAMPELNETNKREIFHSILVLPTGGEKTLTAVYWLLKNAVDNKKKVLWIAHRHLLLEQPADLLGYLCKQTENGLGKQTHYTCNSQC